ncbi:CLUMA_CG018709, isoform A [Clunio marinus]|uniref:CLUMA_CG018709, isoform A n=1 Tax=Clunio marinus TaxID=568069 RepID=A0A1J1J1P2_9DIPT|nr:CLUMA_CG018709, isoform A [Clunio marinus]
MGLSSLLRDKSRKRWVRYVLTRVKSRRQRKDRYESVLKCIKLRIRGKTFCHFYPDFRKYFSILLSPQERTFGLEKETLHFTS